MTPYLLVGFGGALGSLTRYVLGKIISRRLKRSFPLGTLLINISGALLLGIVDGAGLSRGWLLLLADGFLGAYTTFSTFMYEGFSLFHDRKNLNTAVYITGTIFLGLLFYAAGRYLPGLL